jgi:hypothetical protein
VRRTSVTAKGLGVLKRCDRSMDAIETDMLQDLGIDSVELLRGMLASCAHSLETTRPRLPPSP